MIFNRKLDWQEGWDAEVGLYRGLMPGHTAALIGREGLHPGPDNANRLLVAAHCGQLEQMQAETILERLTAMQVRDGGPLHGCPCWYWEEEAPVDTNAAFFTGLSLIVLWVRYRDGLSPRAQELLGAYLRASWVYFEAHTEGEQAVHYPNKVLGDLVCNWMLWEQFEEGNVNPSALHQNMMGAAAYWTEHGWGWGEHMSDLYASVCLSQLSVLLVFSRALPEDLRTAYSGLFRQLMTIEDAFSGGPRVPIIRSYAFKQLRDPHSLEQHTRGFRASVRPLDPDFQPASLRNLSFLGPLLDEAGWHAWADSLEPWPYPREAGDNSIEVPCFGGKVARALVEPNFRMGSVSEYPIMSNCDHFEHGLSWQSMPVALARPDKTWGFLQWSAGTPGRIRSHPAESRSEGGPDNALSKAVYPPLLGKTCSWQRGNWVIAVRLMPQRDSNWSLLADRLRLIGDCGQNDGVTREQGWWRTRAQWEDTTLDIATYPLTFDKGSPQWQAENGLLDFGWKLDGSDLDGLRHSPFAVLWILRIGSPDSSQLALPNVEMTTLEPSSPGQQAWRIFFGEGSKFPDFLVENGSLVRK